MTEPKHRDPPPLTILFSRLEHGSSLLERGDEAARRIFEAHHGLVKGAADGGGGRDIRWVGDGLIVVFRSAAHAVRCAMAIQQASRRLLVDEGLGLCMGLNCGNLAGDESDWFSHPVFLARRLAARASVRQILCSLAVVGDLAERHAFQFRPCGEVETDGAAAVPCFEALYETGDPGALLACMPFVGRRNDLARLQARLGQALNQSGGIVLISGEGGIGKTRLANEFVEGAGGRGVHVLRGACYEGEATRPFGPFIEAIQGYCDSADPDALREDLGPGAGTLARLLPEIRSRLPDVPEPAPLPPDEERDRFVDAAAEFLISLSMRSPLVLIVDDLQWSDPGTVTLLRTLSRRLSTSAALLVGTYRADELRGEHPLAAAIAALHRRANYDHLVLEGLEHLDVSALLRVVADRDPPEELVSVIRNESGGNPLFLRELLLHLLEQKTILDPSGEWRQAASVGTIEVPERVREVIGQRVARLSTDTRRLLSAASAFRSSFELEAATAVADLDRGRALDALDEALAAQILRPAHAPDAYEFSHAILRHTLYRRMSPSRRLETHRRIAEAIEHLHPDRASEQAADIAVHYRQSSPLPGAERGAPFALLAADDAEAVASYATAAGFLRLALELLPRGDLRRPRILARLANALCWAMSFDEALEAAREAAPLIAQAEGEVAAADYLGEAALSMWAAGFEGGAWALASQGLRYCGGRRDLTWVRLMASEVTRRTATDSELPGIPVDGPERREIAAIAEDSPLTAWDRDLLAANAFLSFTARRDVLSRFGDEPGYLMFDRGDYRRSLPLWQERASQCEKEGRSAAAVFHHVNAARCHNALGAFATARQVYEKARALCERLPLPLLRVRLGMADYEMRIASGEGWEELIEQIEPALRWMVGRRHWGTAGLRTAAARAYAHVGRNEEALALLAELILPVECSVGWAPSYAMMALHAAATLWMIQRAEWADVIERNVREKILEPNVFWPMEDARLSLARLCALQGRFEEAFDWLTRARAILEEQGADPLRAIVDHDEAVILLRRGGNEDRNSARHLLERAAARFDALGMVGWTRRVAALQDAATRRVDFAPSTPLEVSSPKAGDVFRKEGEYWTLAYRGKVVRLRDAKGLRDIALLLANPEREFHVADLLASGGSPAALSPGGPRALDAGLRASGASIADVFLDSRARGEYRTRLADLRSELEDAERQNDLGRTSKIKQELEFLAGELASAYGLGGRSRRMGDPAERARKTVTSRIRDSLTRIRRAHAPLGQHLARSIKTGVFCSYVPEQPVHWELGGWPAPT